MLRVTWSEVDVNEKTASGLKDVVEGGVWRSAAKAVTVHLVREPCSSAKLSEAVPRRQAAARPGP